MVRSLTPPLVTLLPAGPAPGRGELPKGAKGRPSVLYVPVRRGFGGSELFPSLPGLRS